MLAPPRREALLEGRDPAFDAAVAWIRDDAAADPGATEAPLDGQGSPNRVPAARMEEF